MTDQERLNADVQAATERQVKRDPKATAALIANIKKVEFLKATTSSK